MDLLGGLLAGLVATLLWTVGTAVNRARRRRKNYRHLAGRYRAFWKATDEDLPGIIVITLRGNVLEVNVEDLEPGDFIHGNIEMSDHLPSTGRGQYKELQSGVTYWGIWEIQVFDADTILVHRTFANADDKRTAIFSGFLWRRIPSSVGVDSGLRSSDDGR